MTYVAHIAYILGGLAVLYLLVSLGWIAFEKELLNRRVRRLHREYSRTQSVTERYGHHQFNITHATMQLMDLMDEWTKAQPQDWRSITQRIEDMATTIVVHARAANQQIAWDIVDGNLPGNIPIVHQGPEPIMEEHTHV